MITKYSFLIRYVTRLTSQTCVKCTSLTLILVITHGHGFVNFPNEMDSFSVNMYIFCREKSKRYLNHRFLNLSS